MFKKFVITFLLAITLVDIYRFTILDVALPDIAITFALCISGFYLFMHLMGLIFIDSHPEVDE